MYIPQLKCKIYIHSFIVSIVIPLRVHGVFTTFRFEQVISFTCFQRLLFRQPTDHVYNIYIQFERKNSRGRTIVDQQEWSVIS